MDLVLIMRKKHFYNDQKIQQEFFQKNQLNIQFNFLISFFIDLNSKKKKDFYLSNTHFI